MQMKIRVQPKAGRNAIEVAGDKVTVRVTAAPEGGKANDAVVELLAKRLGVAKGRVSIVRGHKSRDKTVLIDDVTLEEVLAILTASGHI
ncbi:MAG: DUF167 domain-containing protein [Chloroflexi bacterium]|nr:DUF167 domain-containing protein [Chloroflexota bacterium]MCI0770571.1 DUF167 domain-containing protein [Chloroflexota bacterium]